jgi:AraC-like DNA-binding protein
MAHDDVVLDVRLKPVETLLFRSDIVAAGKFRCPATDPLFRDSGPCSHHTFVFPRTVTAIRFDDGRSFVATPSSVVFYNEHQRYTRARVNEIDASDWFVVAGDVLAEIIRFDDPRRPFAVAEAPVDAAAFLEQRRLFDALDAWNAAAGGSARPRFDALEVEEAVLGVLRRVVKDAREKPKRAADEVEEVKRLLARDVTRNIELRRLAGAVSMSPFALCRAFRARTGETITRYRHTLRLRLALDRLRDERAGITGIALDLGYSSHSHFTAAFRRHFGVAPSAWRAGAGRRS